MLRLGLHPRLAEYGEFVCVYIYSGRSVLLMTFEYTILSLYPLVDPGNSRKLEKKQKRMGVERKPNVLYRSVLRREEAELQRSQAR